ncbi:MAG: zinc-binding dehydrogenase [Anaerolineae bacterium]|nr:zinc-binding dehydrogenase [Anaerolineae bacterium]MDW8099263.1 zinc-binding dehydrogenase [Anaerolineae bacterium]
MRAVVVPEPGHIELRDVPEPTYGEYEALTQILTCSICSGTDTHVIDGQFPIRTFPAILGHESVGRVVACGPRVRHFKPGDLVLRPCAVRPGETLGGYHSMFGGFAEYGVVADAAAIIADTPRGQTPSLPPFAAAQQVLPSDFDPELAGAFITFKETLNFLYRLGVQHGRSLLILGSGTVGLSFIMAAKLIGAHPVLVTGRRPEPLARAMEFGADAVINMSSEDLVQAVRAYTQGRGVDFAVEAVGNWQVLQDGIRALADGGQIGIYGLAPESVATLDWSGTPTNWSLRFLHPMEEEVHQQVIDQVRLGLVNLRRLISHTITMDEIAYGFELVRRRQATKVVVRIR